MARKARSLALSTPFGMRICRSRRLAHFASLILASAAMLAPSSASSQSTPPQGACVHCRDFRTGSLADVYARGLIGKSLNLTHPNGQEVRQTFRWLKVGKLLRWESHPLGGMPDC